MDGLAGVRLQQQLARPVSGAGPQELRDAQDSAAIEKSAQRFNQMVGIVDAQLGRTGAYIAGSQFTVADIAIGLSLHRWRSTPIPRPTYSNVDRYYEQLLTRDGFRRYGRDGGP